MVILYLLSLTHHHSGCIVYHCMKRQEDHTGSYPACTELFFYYVNSRAVISSLFYSCSFHIRKTLMKNSMSIVNATKDMSLRICCKEHIK